MSEKFVLEAKKRLSMGRGASRRLRKQEELIPAIVYGADKEPIFIQLPHKNVIKLAQNESFFSSLLTLNIDDNSKEQVVLKDLQRHPYKRQILHMDFMRIKAGEKIYITIPIHFLGADVAPGVKAEDGVVQYQQKEIEIRCLPEHLPEFIEIDVSHLHLNEGINLSELKLPEGVEIAELAKSPENDRPIVTISVKRKVIEEQPVVAAPTPEEAQAEATATEAQQKSGEEGKSSESK